MAIKLEDITEDRLHDECDRLRSRIAEFEDAICKAIKKANAGGMGDWPAFLELKKVMDQK